MKRTNLVLDGEILEEAKRLLGTKTYSDAVNQALAEAVRRKKMHGLRELFGSGVWAGNLSEMRSEPTEHQPAAEAARASQRK
jgi:Arc/MetJ family transcription regulator